MTQSNFNQEEAFSDLSNKISGLTEELERSNERFETYRKANQALVNLAFGLIASATISFFIAEVFRG